MLVSSLLTFVNPLNDVVLIHVNHLCYSPVLVASGSIGTKTPNTQYLRIVDLDVDIGADAVDYKYVELSSYLILTQSFLGPSIASHLPLVLTITFPL